MMLDFESAKKILATTKQHEGCNPFAQMYTEIFEELETTYINKVEDLEARIQRIESANENELMELNGEIKGLTADNKNLQEQVSTLSKALAQVCKQEKAKEEEKKTDKPRRGRPPKKKVEEAAGEDELAGLREDFGVHDLALDIFGDMEA